MLARTTKTAAELGITEEVLEALLRVRWGLAEGEIRGEPVGLESVVGVRTPRGAFFAMDEILTEYSCSTVGCIGGWVGAIIGNPKYMPEFISDYSSIPEERRGSLYRLYFDYPHAGAHMIPPTIITPARGIEAIDKFLAGWQHPWRTEDNEHAPFVQVRR